MNSMNGKERTAITATKFIFVAVPGGFLFFLATVGFVGTALGPLNIVQLLGTGAAMFTGMAMILFGLNLWGQWRYSLVFISLPLTMWLYEQTGVEVLDPKLDLGIIAGLVALSVNWAIKKSYQRAV